MIPTRVGFTTSKTSWVSRIIRWFTNSQVSHCYLIYWDDEWQRYMIMESVGGLGGSVRIVNFNENSKSIVKIVTPKFDLEYGMRKMVDRLGEAYDYQGLIGMAWVEIGRWLKKKWRNPWHSSNALFCSELIAQVMIDSSYPGSEKFSPESTDPEMLLQFFESEEQPAS